MKGNTIDISWFKEACARHRVALVAALLVSLVSGSHHIFISFFAAQEHLSYYPVTEAASYDEGADYAPRAQAAYEGVLGGGDIALAEYAHQAGILPILNPLIMAGLGFLTGSFRNGIIASDFVFPALIFFFVYLIAHELTHRRLVSVLFAFFFMFFPKVGIMPSLGAFSFLTSARELYFSRFEYPAVTFIFFALALYLVLRAMRIPTKSTVISGGISVGILFYTYLYDLVYVSAALVFLALYYVWVHDRVRVKAIVQIGCIAAVVSLGYWGNMWLAHAAPAFSDVVSRMGVEVGRHIRVDFVLPTYFRAVLFSLLVWWLYRRNVNAARHVSRPFLVALLLPIIFLLNVQVITGFVPQPDHWYRTQFLPWALVLMLACSVYTASYFRFVSYRVRRMVALGICSVIFFYGIFLQYAVSVKDFRLYVIDPVYASAYAWLTAEIPPGSVVGSLSSVTNGEVLIHTPHKVFMPNGFLTMAPNDELWNRVEILSAQYGLSPSEFSNFVADHVFYLFVLLYGDHSFGSAFRKSSRDIPDDILEKRRAEYASLVTRKNGMHPYKLDYLVVGPREEVFSSSTPRFVTMPLVYKSNGVRIYQFTNE